MALSVYIHFPYCLQKCPYCDFASASIPRSEVPSKSYADALLQELAWRAPDLAESPLSSIFFGGGTPSLWEPSELGRVLSAVQAAFPARLPDPGGLEVTVECNPSSLDRTRASALREVGVNRLSIGVQSLDAQRLRFLGRLHDGPGAIRALQDAMAEMPRVSADLMFGMPGQEPRDFLDELHRLLDLELTHLSVYALTVEQNTQFGALHRKGKLQLAPEGDFADTFMRTHEAMQERGFEHYEVSNYAQPGEGSRHNQHYWRGGTYLGLGAGAVGCVPQQALGKARRYRNTPDPRAYEQNAASAACEVFEESLSENDLMGEALMLGLRTSVGVDRKAVHARLGTDVLAGRERAVARQRERGNLLVSDQDLRVPHARWLHLDSIVADLF